MPMPAWRRWSDDDPHPWVAKLAKAEGKEFFTKHCHEVRFYSPEGALWPLVSLETRIVAPGMPFSEGMNRSVVPGMNLGVAVKTSANGDWQEGILHAAIPIALVAEATAMLGAAAFAAASRTDDHAEAKRRRAA